MDQNPQEVSTESQRLALEAMSANLVHKLNAMISEQEARAHAFAAQHHSTLPTPQPLNLPVTQPQPAAAPTPQPSARKRTAEAIPPPPARTAIWEPPSFQPSPKPVRRAKPSKAQQQPEENNIGFGMVAFAVVGIIMLIRSCT